MLRLSRADRSGCRDGGGIWSSGVPPARMVRSLRARWRWCCSCWPSVACSAATANPRRLLHGPVGGGPPAGPVVGEEGSVRFTCLTSRRGPHAGPEWRAGEAAAVGARVRPAARLLHKGEGPDPLGMLPPAPAPTLGRLRFPIGAPSAPVTHGSLRPALHRSRGRRRCGCSGSRVVERELTDRTIENQRSDEREAQGEPDDSEEPRREPEHDQHRQAQEEPEYDEAFDLLPSRRIHTTESRLRAGVLQVPPRR